MFPIRMPGEKSVKMLNTTKRKKLRTEKANMRSAPEVAIPKFGMIRFRLMAYGRAPGSSNCYICGVAGHFERFCPYNYIYGRYYDKICRGECTPGPEHHRITSEIDCKFLQCSVRVNNMAPGFRECDLKELFSPFGPLLIWDVPRLTSTSTSCNCRSMIPLSFGVVVFKKREDGEKAIHELNGYESRGHKLRIDWFYPSCNGKILKEQPAMQGELPTSPWITAPKRGRRFGTHLAIASVRRKILKERRALQGAVNQRLVVFHSPKFWRFFNLQEMLFVRQRKVKVGREKDMVLVKMALRKESTREECATSFWKDPDATFCSICGDDKEDRLELMCPYNYLSPAAYSPCKTRLALWGNYTTTLRYKCSRHKEKEQSEPPMHDEENSRRLGFMRCFVRVNNLPEQCHPEELATLFSRFGPLRMWHVAITKSGECKGFGGIVFKNRDHAYEAIEALNCHAFGNRNLRVDWAYPCLNCEL